MYSYKYQLETVCIKNSLVETSDNSFLLLRIRILRSGLFFEFHFHEKNDIKFDGKIQGAIKNFSS